MSELINEISGHFDYSLLMFLRVSGIIIISPIFGRKNVPKTVKICFCIALTCLFLSAFPFPDDWSGPASLAGYFLMCLKELMFGAALGFIMTVFFDLAYSAGQLMDMQIGFGIVSVYDIQNNSQVPVVGNMLNLMLLILFYGVNGHLKVISIIYSTIERVPIGHVVIGTGIAAAVWEAFSLSFILSAMVAMPLIAAGVAMEIAMGVLIRSVPQINMFVIGIPVKLFAGLVVFAALIPVFANFSKTIFSQMFISIENVFSAFGVSA